MNKDFGANFTEFAEFTEKPAARRSGRTRFTVAAAAVLGAGIVLTSGCTLDPPGPSPIYSRLPANQSGVAATAPALSPQELKRYDAIDQQALNEQAQAMAAEAAAEAWARAYAPPPVSVYGSYSSGGWGRGWGGGIGYGYPGWGWGW
ncbi:hypothetical protein [Paraburkholderia bannensis]|uniref:hypothetical protein n=1 Tax=Paraburkholderia bannensis TaxID=765414 RepID=UPI002AB2CFA5|nr:hypothetical protein [Paraburkholderia bannensis]